MKKRRKIGKTRRKTSRNKPLKKNLNPKISLLRKPIEKEGKKQKQKRKPT
jgi:hypothetical protein